MPTRAGRLTPTELVFAETYAATRDHIYSATKAGYADPPSGATRALQRPAVQAAIVEKESATIRDELLPMATNKLRQALAEKSAAPWGSQMKAVEIVYKHAFGDKDAGSGKSPAEMGPAELAAAIDRMERMKADMARPIIQHEDNSPKPSVFE